MAAACKVQLVQLCADSKPLTATRKFIASLACPQIGTGLCGTQRDVSDRLGLTTSLGRVWRRPIVDRPRTGPNEKRPRVASNHEASYPGPGVFAVPWFAGDGGSVPESGPVAGYRRCHAGTPLPRFGFLFFPGTERECDPGRDGGRAIDSSISSAPPPRPPPRERPRQSWRRHRARSNISPPAPPMWPLLAMATYGYRAIGDNKI